MVIVGDENYVTIPQAQRAKGLGKIFLFQ